MPIFKVNVKWKKNKYSDVECNTDESPEIFKASLYSLTGVPPDRQKVMMPGKILSDDNYNGIRLKDGITVMLIGTADELPSLDSSVVPEQLPVVEESISKLPYGLVNLGNTCYMNAAVQLLYSVPEIRIALQSASLPTTSLSNNSMEALCASLKLLFGSLDKAEKPVIPAFFLTCLHNVCPQFATRSSASDKSKASGFLSLVAGGGFDQQDASECWAELVRALQRISVDPQLIPKLPNLPASFHDIKPWNPIERFFTGTLSSELTSTESEEPLVQNEETFTHLSCFMNQEVKYLLNGIRNGFQGTVTKHSSALNRDAVYRKTTLIKRLPAYLCIQFVRFFYKEDKHLNAKILKDVKFPLSLDMYEFCTPDMQSKLIPMREKIRMLEELQVTKVENVKLDVTKKSALELHDPYKHPENFEPHWFADDPGSNNSGYYELQGVLSHQGRTSSSGHYVAWVKNQGMWLKFDDDKVSEVTPEDILRLSGGGDWHCAYILLYAPRWVPKDAVNSNISDKPSEAAATLDGDILMNQSH